MSYPNRAWAALLDLPDPEGTGARRVADALRWLEAKRFVEIAAIPGQPHKVTLLDERGEGDQYEVPGAAFNRLRQLEKRADPTQPRLLGPGGGDHLIAQERNRYVLKLPAAFWTRGYLLSCPALRSRCSWSSGRSCRTAILSRLNSGSRPSSP